MRRPFKDAMVALSLANLCFIPSWRYILEPSSSDYYYSWKAFPRWSELAAISVNVLILAACFWTCVYVVRRFGRPTLFTTGRIFVVLVFLVVLNDVRIQLVFLQRPTLVATLGTGGFIGLISLLTVVAVVLAIRVGLTQTARAVQATLLVLFPVFVVTFLHAFWLTTKFDAVVVSAKPPAIQQAKHANARILWVIFDELDYRLGFDFRPANLELPELDRLKKESIFARNAFPTSKWTRLSLPALIDGKLVPTQGQSVPTN